MGLRKILEIDVDYLFNTDEPACPTSRHTPNDAVAHLMIFHRFVAGGARMLVRVAGEIDLTTVPALAEALDLARFAAAKVPELIEIEVDLRAVEFLSAAGLTELVRTRRCCDQDGVLLHVVADQAAVARPLQLTGLDQVLGLHAAPVARSSIRVSRIQP